MLFSGQSAVPGLVGHAAGYTVGALVLLLACKGLAYGCSLAAFRGGPIFPAIFLGAAGGVAMSHLPGLPLVPAIAMGIGAMSAVMLRLPMTSVLLATLLLFSDGLVVTPLAIVAVVVAYVAAARISSDPLPGDSGTAGAPSPRRRPSRRQPRAGAARCRSPAPARRCPAWLWPERGDFAPPGVEISR